MDVGYTVEWQLVQIRTFLYIRTRTYKFYCHGTEESGLYNADEEEVAYFCFPKLGVAVLLRPGDALIFDPQEPHCLSSCCNADNELVCLSLHISKE